MGAPRIFVSHNHEDKDFCDALVRALRAAGADVWYDEHGGAGHLFDVIQTELQARSIFVVVLSKAAIASEWVRRECMWAYSLTDGNPSRTLLPVTAGLIEPHDLMGNWFFIKDYRRIEAPGYRSLPRDTAIEQTLRTLGLTPTMNQQAGPPDPLNQSRGSISFWSPGTPRPDHSRTMWKQWSAAEFDVIDPDDPSDPYPHQLVFGLPSGAPGKGWAIVGSSRRGLANGHEGKYREDGMAFDIVDSWHLVAVADGTGNATLARVGANVAVLAALDAMKAQIGSNRGLDSRFGPGPKTRIRLMPREIARRAILAGFRGAYDVVRTEADRRHESVKQLRATLLLLAHRQEPNGTHIVAGGQIGDGIIVGRDAAGRIEWFGTPDTGPAGNEVLFLQDVDPAEWPGRVIVDDSWYGPGCHFLVMTDGVADDFLPIDENLERLEKPLFASVLAGRPPAEAANELTKLLGYQRQGSFDDRTLVCIYELA